MKIVFDYQAFTLQSYGGISRYFVRLTQRLIGLGHTVDIVAPIHQNQHLKDLSTSVVHGFAINQFPAKTTRLFLLINRILGKNRLNRLAAEVLHETYYSARPSTEVAKARVLTVYDMIHEKYNGEYANWDQNSKIKRLAVNRADQIICISNSTKNDLCQIFNVPENRVSVVHLGFEKLRVTPGDLPDKDNNRRPFLLYVGSRKGYKNFERMLRAVALSRKLNMVFDIVAFGGGCFNAAEQALISRLGYRIDAVRQVGGEDHVLGQLYAHATALVYPSLYEGFGLPPLEAMAHDCPVVTSNSSSMPEVVGDAGAYFDPLDIEEQAQAIESVVFDEQRRSELVAAGRQRLQIFSWERCAYETQAVYRMVLESKNG